MRSLAAFAIDTVLGIAGKLAKFIFLLAGWRFICFCGGIAGDVFYYFAGRKRKLTENEIDLLFGRQLDRATVKNIAKKSFENYYKRMAENLFFGDLRGRTLDDMVRLAGREHLDLALSKGKGVILLLSHFGSFLLPLPYLGHLGYRVNQLAGNQSHPSLLGERIWNWRKREADKLPVKFIQTDQFLRPVFKALAGNELVAIAFDGRKGTNWVDVDFLGRKALFSPGPFALARRTGAAIIPTFVVRNKDNSHTIILEQPFSLSEGSGSPDDLKCTTQNFADILSGYVGKYPCHFGLVLFKVKTEYKMLKTAPLFVESE